MADHFVVEADRRPVGVAVRGPSGFTFFSSDAAFLPLEGRAFPRARALVNSVAKFARRNRVSDAAAPRP